MRGIIERERVRVRGQVCIRSNVCTDPTARHLVPGDELRRHGLHYGRLTQKQHDEMMYYEPCAICRRRIYEINEDGCDQAICRRHGVPSSADAAQRKQRYEENIEERNWASAEADRRPSTR